MSSRNRLLITTEDWTRGSYRQAVSALFLFLMVSAAYGQSATETTDGDPQVPAEVERIKAWVERNCTTATSQQTAQCQTSLKQFCVGKTNLKRPVCKLWGVPGES